MSRLVHPGIKAVFFDAVGTLIFPEPGAGTVYAQAAARRSVNVDPSLVRDRLWTAYQLEDVGDLAAGWVTSENRECERWQRIVRASLPELTDLDDCFQELFEHFSKPSAWQVNPEAEGVFTELRQRGVTLGLASNYDSRLLSVIAGHPELQPLRERLVISAAVGYRKPSRHFFQKVIDSAGCQPHEILFVGDDVGNDYVGAYSAGLKPVLLDSKGRHGADERIDTLIHSLTELL